ncbi:hypothetical protein RIF29_12527 [Crotalaria pallida]|uniref:Uncharacterized protein n=1 Tax=Crotalaria pallida TaxID=3830 RepID=A0AAN9IND2_CROPI
MAASNETLVCVKQVKQEVTDEWDESMPLPGDIIEGFSEHSADDFFMPMKTRSELSTQLGKISPKVEFIWIKVRRSNSLLKLQARVVQLKGSILHRKYTIQAATDHRHIVDLEDLTLQQCTELQETSWRAINVESRGFIRRGIKYDWKMKVGMYLPDQRCLVISSILFMPLLSEHSINTTTARCMAWFSAAISSGVPLVFVNIQTEQIMSVEKTNSSRRESGIFRQQIHNTPQILHGIRLWFLPGLAEISIDLIPRSNEVRFGMEINRTEEGFVCIYSVVTGSSADRVGLRELCEESLASGFLLVISRLKGKSLMPTSVCSDGLVHCCDQSETKDILTTAIEQFETIQLHVMSWPNQTRHSPPHAVGFPVLLPPKGSFPTHHDDSRPNSF